MKALTDLFFLVLLFLSTVLLSSCLTFTSRDGPPTRQVDVSKIPNAKPKIEPKSRCGNASSYVVRGKRYHVLKSSRGYSKTGVASWYGMKFHHRKTSNGEEYNLYKMTAAHKTLPLPTYVRITNLVNGRQIIVRINDRGPFERNRLIDLSYVAAKKLGMLARGTGIVKIDALDPAHLVRTQFKSKHYQHHYNPRIYVQVGAYTDVQNARAILHKAQKINHTTAHIYFTKNGDKKSLYRVQLGPVRTVEEADKLASLMETKGFKETLIVVKQS